MIGIAKPNPSIPVELSFALTIPIRLPSALNNPPPEFPGLMAASVCRSVIVSSSIVICLSVAEIIPVVTVPPSSPNGFPMAMAGSPTCKISLSPSVAACRLFASTLITAKSVCESLPTTLASYSVPSVVVTFKLVAPLTTWLFVTIYPSLLMMTPLPAPCETYCPKMEFPLETDSVVISTTLSLHFSTMSETSDT